MTVCAAPWYATVPVAPEEMVPPSVTLPSRFKVLVPTKFVSVLSEASLAIIVMVNDIPAV